LKLLQWMICMAERTGIPFTRIFKRPEFHFIGYERFAKKWNH
jgi:hypothetical protein